MAVSNYIQVDIVQGTVTDTRYYGYDEALQTCAEAGAYVQGLKLAQLLALATTRPVEPFRMVWTGFTCGTGDDVITDVVSLDPLDQAGGETTSTGTGGTVTAQGTALYNGQRVAYITLAD